MMKSNSLMWVLEGMLLFCFCISGVTAIPVAAFSGTPTLGIVPLTVAFTDASSGGPTGWTWYFGDEPYTDSMGTSDVECRLVGKI